MATANFYYENILVSKDVEDDLDVEDAILSVQNGLEKMAGGCADDRWHADSPRSFGGRVIWEGRLDKEYVDGSLIYAEVRVIVRSGYYEGINFDYEVDRDVEYEDVTETKKMEAKLNTMIRRVEKVLKENGDELRRVATFSNGETIYEAVK